MAPSVSVEDWSVVDGWWGLFKQERQFILAAAHFRQMERTWKKRNWESVDDLWEAFKTDRELLLDKRYIRALADVWKADAWTPVDDFWDSYAEQQQAGLIELRKKMKELKEVWAGGASHLDDDPLTTNWRPESRYEGPMRTTVNEEDWSQWLAHLLRTSTGAFARKLLGVSDEPPGGVQCEVVFFGKNSARRADILIEYENTAVSIEVKIGDEQYKKTLHTAELIERHDNRDWSHILLLPKDQLPRLRQTFNEEIDSTQEGAPTIQSDQSADIAVSYWEDVSRALRRTLLDGSEPHSHWEASAYLFITLIEQRILEFYPFSALNLATISERATAADFETTTPESDAALDPEPAAETTESGGRNVPTDLLRLVAFDPTAQINYLKSILDENTTHG